MHNFPLFEIYHVNMPYYSHIHRQLNVKLSKQNEIIFSLLV